MILIVPFSRKYDRASFDCGVDSLNDWLKSQAGQQERKGNTRTFLAVDIQGRGIGGLLLQHFFTGALDVAELIGVEVVVVDAIDETAGQFYGVTDSSRSPMRRFH
ncbi:MAG: hypothetical protein JJE28_06170 [Actinomycetales bacterium]|nr:hypothetical protein [Actinomycetales bacterium]